MGLREAINKVNEAIEHADGASKKSKELAKPLTTQQRKKLKAGTFCGPNRSFPVPDCTRVRAAKVYLNRSKFSLATKKKIAACINRKAKALGCPGTKPAKAKGAEEKIDKKLQELMDSKEFETTKALVDQSIENEGLDLDFANCEEC
jgi:hypothetical protein